ncbi:MAG: phosphoglycerate mutase [Gammaproteobacteria bacterium]|nr:phosphoglycerate mutase [Gammaproteobacteria bacterium]
MKTLYLLRHAKSSWQDRSLQDIERPLKPRGKRDCQLIGEALQAMDFFSVDAVFCSPAMRARMTIERVLKAAQLQGDEWSVNESLYTFDVNEALRVVRWLDRRLNRVMIVGHNPAFTELCNDLGDAELDNLPTCGCAEIQLDIEQWREAAAGSGSLSALLTPKMLRAKQPDDTAHLYR